jgi:hypothetical protein
VRPFTAAAQEDQPGSDVRPQKGDSLVRAEPEHAGKIITPGDLQLGEPPLSAWPKDPKTSICYISGLAGITGFHALVSFILHLLGGEAIDDGFAQTFALRRAVAPQPSSEIVWKLIAIWP